MKFTKEQLKEAVREHVSTSLNSILKESGASEELVLDEDLGMAGDIALGIMGGVAGLYALRYGVPAALGKFGDVVHNWKKNIDAENYRKAKVAAEERLQAHVESIASKFENDTELSAMLIELDKYPHTSSIAKKAEKGKKMRADLLRKINAHVKSKLSPREQRFVTDLNKYLRGENFKRA